MDPIPAFTFMATSTPASRIALGQLAGRVATCVTKNAAGRLILQWLSSAVMPDVTQILSKIAAGDQLASRELLPLVYDELRRLAAARVAQENPGQTLQATALVHEAYVRLVDTCNPQAWDSRGHFFAAAAEAMRRILIEQARRKLGPKAGGNHERLALSDIDPAIHNGDVDVIALSDSLDLLSRQDGRAAQVVKLRYFAGLTIPETAAALGVSEATVKTDWLYAKNWLRAALAANP